MAKKMNKKNLVEKNTDLATGKRIKVKENQQLFWFFVIILMVFASFLIGYFYVQSNKTFSFAGAEWVKEDYSGLLFFHGKFPIIYQKTFVANYNIYFRNDPRTNKIPVSNNITMGFWPEIIISNSQEAADCSGAGRVTNNIGMLLSSFPWVKNITGAVRDDITAKDYELAQADCSNAVEKTVILIQTSKETEVLQDKFNENCYIIKVGNCENDLASERFMIEIMNQLKSN